jgi:hypothetical protein
MNGTLKENINHAWKQDCQNCKRRKHKFNLTEKEVLEIRKRNVKEIDFYNIINSKCIK